MRAEKIAGKVGIGANLIYMLHKPRNFYYEFLIWTKAMKGVRNVFRNIFEAYVVSFLID